MVEIIGVIITGIIIGFVGKSVAPGSRANTPMWLTFLRHRRRFDWLVYLQRFWRQWLSWNRLVRWLIAIAAVVLVVIASTLTGRNTLGSGDDSPLQKIVRV